MLLAQRLCSVAAFLPFPRAPRREGPNPIPLFGIAHLRGPLIRFYTRPASQFLARDLLPRWQLLVQQLWQPDSDRSPSFWQQAAEMAILGRETDLRAPVWLKLSGSSLVRPPNRFRTVGWRVFQARATM